MAISAATLADIYDTHERGTMMGMFFAAPLLGPALGPILGGSLSQAFDWRASFYFLLICEVLIFLSFLILFKDTYRRERSLTYCSALQRLLNSKEAIQSPNGSIIAGHESDKGQTDPNDIEKQLQTPGVPDNASVVTSTPGLDDVRLSIRDINPFPPYFQILSRKNNVFILIANGERRVVLLQALLLTSLRDKDSSSDLPTVFHTRALALSPTHMVMMRSTLAWSCSAWA
jgi:MFS family permease